MENLNNNGRLPMGIKLGYGAAALSDGTAYVFFYSFFLLFLTDYAGVNPLWAGSISLIVVLWDAITDPIIGWLSDNCKSKMGRRRPFMLLGIFPWLITLTLMYTKVDLTGGAQFAYYVVMAMLFWTSYTLCDVPYKALGAEITANYSERATIRMFVQFFSSSGVAISGICTMLLVGFFANIFNTDPAHAWTFVALSYGILSVIGYLVTFFAVKGWDKPLETRVNLDKKENVIITYVNIIKEVKPLRYLLAAIFVFMCGNSLYGSGIYYMYPYLLGWDAGQIATVGLFTTFLGIGAVFVLNPLVKKFDKRNVLLGCLAISTIGCFLFKIVGIYNVTTCVIYLVMYAASNLGFWAIIWSIVYDCAEVDELLNNRRREGSTTAVGSLIQKCGSALALWLVGFVLALGGYDATAAVQTEEALNGILNTVTLYPAIFTGLTFLILLAYPLTSKKYELVVKAIEQKRETGDFDKEGLERII